MVQKNTPAILQLYELESVKAVTKRGTGLGDREDANVGKMTMAVW